MILDLIYLNRLHSCCVLYFRNGTAYKVPLSADFSCYRSWYPGGPFHYTGLFQKYNIYIYFPCSFPLSLPTIPHRVSSTSWYFLLFGSGSNSLAYGFIVLFLHPFHYHLLPCCLKWLVIPILILTLFIMVFYFGVVIRHLWIYFYLIPVLKIPVVAGLYGISYFSLILLFCDDIEIPLYFRFLYIIIFAIFYVQYSIKFYFSIVYYFYSRWVRPMYPFAMLIPSLSICAIFRHIGDLIDSHKHLILLWKIVAFFPLKVFFRST